MRQGNEKSIHWVNGRPYCIREVEMEWGVPKIEDNKIDSQIEASQFGIYEDYNAALAYIKNMQRVNGGLL